MARRDRLQLINIESSSLIADRYKVLKCVGLGSYAVVYKCEDTKLKDRIVALKILLTPMIDKLNADARFVKEAIYSYEINHKNVVRVFDYLDTSEISAISMEYVNGGDLRTLIQSKDLEFAPALNILIQICEGVQAIHEAGVVHRDLKPENILISREGLAKITDFGVARMPNATQLTHQGGIVGSVSYICPEYFANGQMDQRGDLYALGVLGYELITGQNPHAGATLIEIIQHRLKRAPAKIKDVVSNCPIELQSIIEKAMSETPEDRYQSASEMLTELLKVREWCKGTYGDSVSISATMRRLLPDELESTVPPPRSLFRRNLVSATSALVGGVVFACITAATSVYARGAYPSVSDAVQNVALASVGLKRQSELARLESAQLIPVVKKTVSLRGDRPSVETVASAQRIRAVSSVKQIQVPQKLEQSQVLSSPVQYTGELSKTATSKSLVPVAARVLAPKKESTRQRARAKLRAPKAVNNQSPPMLLRSVKTSGYEMEYKVKAALIYRFLENIQWEDSSPELKTLCIVGEDPFGSSIDKLSKKKLRVERIKLSAGSRELKACSIAFLSGWQNEAVNPIVNKLHRFGVITITERLSSGVIHFFVRRGRVNYDVNSRLAQKLGVKIAPDLLRYSTSG